MNKKINIKQLVIFLLIIFIGIVVIHYRIECQLSDKLAFKPASYYLSKSVNVEKKVNLPNFVNSSVKINYNNKVIEYVNIMIQKYEINSKDNIESQKCIDFEKSAINNTVNSYKVKNNKYYFLFPAFNTTLRKPLGVISWVRSTPDRSEP